MGFFDKIKAGLKKTRDSITGQINSMLHAFTKIDEELFEELEELLVMADVGMNTATEICDTLRTRVKERGITDPNEIMTLLQEVVTEMVSGDNELHLDTQPSVILVIGVNGVGKTTTIGKLASRLKKEGKSVILGAAVLKRFFAACSFKNRALDCQNCTGKCRRPYDCQHFFVGPPLRCFANQCGTSHANSRSSKRDAQHFP